MTNRMLGAALATLVLVASAHATAVFVEGNDISNFVNVTGTSGEVGMTIHAFTNNAAHIPILFVSPDVLVGGSGAANLMAQTGQFISSLTISAPGFTFNAIEFNPFGLSASGILMVSALMSNGQTFQCPGPACSLTTFGGSGNNRMTVLARDGERIESVTISSTGGPGTGFEDVRQVRFNQGEGGFEVIPEPGTLGLLGTGLIGLAGMVRRKLRDESTASKLKAVL